jgi:hypothetical protein
LKSIEGTSRHAEIYRRAALTILSSLTGEGYSGAGDYFFMEALYMVLTEASWL